MNDTNNSNDSIDAPDYAANSDDDLDWGNSQNGRLDDKERKNFLDELSRDEIELDDEEDDHRSKAKSSKQPQGISDHGYFQETIQGTFDSTIKKVSAKLLNSPGKLEEMNQFKDIIAGFDNWFLANDTNWSRDDYQNDHNQDYQDDLQKPTFEFVVYDKETNAFTLPFSDVYINVVVKKRGYRPTALRYVVDYLRSQQPDAYIQEFLSDEKKNRRKVIFRFITGNTKFIFMVNIELHLRFHQLLKQYSIVDDRFLLMGTFLSYWAHMRGLWKDDYLNAQTLYLMIVYFLIVQDPPVLPIIYDKSVGESKEIPKKGGLKGVKKQGILKIDLHWETDIHKIKAKITDDKKNTMKVGELVTRFFYMFSHDIPALQRTISIKKGRLLEPKKRMNGYSVEDPFFEGYDTCRILNNSNTEAYKTVKQEFVRAYRLISESKIKELCQKYSG